MKSISIRALTLSLVLISKTCAQVVSPSSNVTNVAIDLLDASHILHFLDVVDAFGHVSSRNPDNSSQFIMTFAIAPALATSQSLVTYEIDNATAIQLTFNTSAFPDVTGVVHAHTTSVIPFAAAGIGLKAQMGVAGSLGALTHGTPIFDFASLPTSVLPEDAPHNLLVGNEVLGNALAGTFSNDSAVVLMTGHGMAVRGTSVRNVVFRSYYTMENANVQSTASFLGALAMGGKPPTGLSPRVAMDATTTNEGVSLYVFRFR
ncbi:hypothetical protein GYMLUDRAFT_221365 [Collybiopsis luxurians FD-317 M1]|uniref:Class II aldolase/adducin N-terminal domain-containing protein n=1 Tax=Collybiopsis luxurians FD-317 M1 TaxID=944289 RepID=A0A0D0D445_9AGAR|nr:hypothetical protein GYMLUDRAFT_221365 [Collybiopsis luxurians FD-317 M1]